MIELTVKAKDVDELIAYWERLGELIEDGYLSGTLLDGWDITDLEQV
jgi:hypothetical protein